jgi:hypothetical protein
MSEGQSRGEDSGGGSHGPAREFCVVFLGREEGF